MKKNFWIKLTKDFFDKSEIRILENQTNGSKYLLFYLKLLVLSIERNGSLRINDLLAFDTKSLAVVTGINVDIVKQGLLALMNLELIEILDDKTIIIHQAAEMLDGETKWAQYKRTQRARKAIEEPNQPPKLDNIQNLSKKSPIDIDKELDISIDKELECESARTHA